MDWSVLIAVAGTLAGIVLGTRLTAKSQLQADLRARRELMYMDWAKFLTTLPSLSMDAVVEARPNDYVREAERRLSEITAEVELFASAEVQKAWQALRERIGSREYHEFSERLRETEANVRDVFRKLWGEGLRDQRRSLFEAMRRDLGTDARSRQRRK